MRKLATIVATTGLMAAALIGPAFSQDKMEVIHWLNGEANSKKLGVVAEALKAQGIEWVDNSVPSPDNARSLEMSRLLAGDPPAVMQWNIGGPLFELAAQDLLRPLDDFAKEMDWEHVLPPALLASISSDGHVWAVPMGTMSITWLWWNVKEFEALGLAPPDNWEDVFAANKKFEEAGKIGLVMGNDDWSIIHIFNSVLANVADTEIYNKYLIDHSVEAVRSPQFLKAIETYLKIRDAADPGAGARGWMEAADLLFTGKAGMQHMGDWMKGAVLSAGLKPGVDIGCVSSPGAHHYWIDATTFVMPKTDDPAKIKMQDAFVRTLMSKDVQVNASLVDSSTPARLDIDTSKLDPCAQAGIAGLRDPNAVQPSPNGPDFHGAMKDAYMQAWGDKSITAPQLVEKLVAVMEQFPTKK